MDELRRTDARFAACPHSISTFRDWLLWAIIIKEHCRGARLGATPRALTFCSATDCQALKAVCTIFFFCTQWAQTDMVFSFILHSPLSLA